MDPRESSVRRQRLLRISRAVATAVALGCVLSTSSCSEDRLYNVGAVEVVPNPAQQGDVVTFVFVLTVVPERNFTVRAVIDSTAHASQTLQRLYDDVFEFEVGEASDLIAQYGLGPHEALIQVRINDDGTVLQSQTTAFELQ